MSCGGSKCSAESSAETCCPRPRTPSGEIRDLRLEGRVLRIRLEALRERYRLNVPDGSDAARPPEPEVIRIVCSDGLAG